MEKTVEIDESMEVLKDLERLRSGPPEHIPSSGDETSPVHSQDVNAVLRNEIGYTMRMPLAW